jgi:hypothetical protein
LAEDRVQRHGIARLDGPEQRDFEEDALGSGIPQASFRRGQHFQDPGQGVGVEALGLLGEDAEFVVAHLQEGTVAAGNHEEQQVSEMGKKVAQESAKILAALGKAIQFAEDGFGVGGED